MGQHVDAGDIHRAKRRAAGPAERRTRDGIHFFDGVLAARNRIERPGHAIERDVIADEVRRVLGDDDALAEMMVGEIPNGLDDCRLGLRRRDQLEQAQVARRVEEMRAEPVTPEIFTTAFRKQCDGYARGVRADNRPWSSRLVHSREELLLDVETLDDCFHDPVDGCQSRKAIVESGGCDESPDVGRELRIGLEPNRLLEAVACELWRQVEQQDRNAGIRAVQRDLGTHGAGAEDRDGVDSHADGGCFSTDWLVSPQHRRRTNRPRHRPQPARSSVGD